MIDCVQPPKPAASQADSDAIARRAVRKALIERGWSSADLASATGYHVRRICNCLAGNDRTQPIRQAINSALGRNFFVMTPKDL